jgi:hypothetical protein
MRRTSVTKARRTGGRTNFLGTSGCLRQVRFWEPQSRDLLPAISERPLMVQCLHEARQGKTDERADRIPEGGSSR